jgi:hypothetical protein
VKQEILLHKRQIKHLVQQDGKLEEGSQYNCCAVRRASGNYIPLKSIFTEKQGWFLLEKGKPG